VPADSAMRATFCVQRAAFDALEIHLAREEIREHGAENENAAEHDNGNDCVQQVFHDLVYSANPDSARRDSSVIVES
jgi:hypothetical protein